MVEFGAGPRPDGRAGHEPPLLYDVEVDPTEAYPLDPATDPAAAAALAAIDALAAAHLEEMLPLPASQMEAQSWSVVPCANTGFNVTEAAALLLAGEVGPAIWDNCIL